METVIESFGIPKNDNDLDKNSKKKQQKPEPEPEAPQKVGSVRCPYCQTMISFDSFLFRAKNPEDEEKLKAKYQNGIISDDEYKKRLQYAAKTDEAMIDFWTGEVRNWKRNNVHLREVDNGYSEFIPEDKSKPHETKRDLPGKAFADVTCCVLSNEQIDKDKTVTVGLGYPVSVTDKRGETTTQKICPKCHCILPPDYGLHKTFFIACTGIKQSGKTVLLSQLFKTMSGELSRKVNVMSRSMNAELFWRERLIQTGVSLPDGTNKETFKPPVFFSLNKHKDEKEYTFVFYDIAGENCISIDAMRSKGSFIENADGIIMLISPKQLSDIYAMAENEENDVLKVLDTLHFAFENNKNNTSLAVVISKCDEYDNVERVPAAVKETDEKKYKTMYEQRKILHENITTMLKGTELYNYATDDYTHMKFFASSALGHAPLNNIPQGEINPRRLADPLIWFLCNFGIIKDDKPSLLYMAYEKIKEVLMELWRRVTRRH